MSQPLKDPYIIAMEFPSKEHAHRFFSWLCDGGGEQDYWNVADDHSEAAVSFDYFSGSKEFLGNGKVVCSVMEDDPDEDEDDLDDLDEDDE